jgi:hypothetical protein
MFPSTHPQVDLVAHSAGGWLGRAYLADPKYLDPQAVELATQAAGLDSQAAELATRKSGLDSQAAEPLKLLSEVPPLVASTSGGSLSSFSLSSMFDSLASLGSSDSSSESDEAAVSRRPNVRVRSLVTLGTPQRPPPADKMKDMTGRWGVGSSGM